MEELSTDILVIGSGLAGMMSALEAEKSGLKTLMVGKFAIGMGTNTSMANGLFTVANALFSKDDHFRATLDAGRGLNRLQMVKTLVEKGPGHRKVKGIWCHLGREGSRISGRATRKVIPTTWSSVS